MEKKKIQELQTLADEIKEIVFAMCPNIRKGVTITVKDVKRGAAHYGTQKITIPIWPYVMHSEEYFFAYVIHELVHFYNGRLDHGKKFKETETDMLKSFGLTPAGYKRAYYSELYSGSERVFISWRKVRRDKKAAGIGYDPIDDEAHK
jgi:hypothetical protein